MRFSYVQGSYNYKQLLKSDIVALFLDRDLTIRYASANNDVLGVAPGMFIQDFPVIKFMPEPAMAKLRAFLERHDNETIIEYEFIASGDHTIPVRHYFYMADAAGFGDEIALRSYVVPVSAHISKTDVLIAKYETALIFIGMMENLPMGIFVHDGHKIEYVSKTLARLLGHASEELVGIPPVRIFRDGSEVLWRLCGKGRFAASVLRKNGSAFTANVYVQTEEPNLSYFVMLGDAADYHSREQADSVLRRLFEFSSKAAALLDAERNLIWVNNSFEKFIDYPEGSLDGKPVSQLYSSEHKTDFYDSVWESVAVDGLYRGTVWVRVREGNLPAMLTIAVIKAEDRGALTYVITLTHAPNTIVLAEHESDPNKDELTGVYTKEHFDALVERKLDDCRANNDICAVVMFDIDRFNTVNEMYGVEIADLLLKQVAARFAKYLPEGAVVAREEDSFWAIVEAQTLLEDMESFANGLIASIDRTFYVSSLEIDIYISISVVFFDDDSPTKEMIYKHLAQSLYVPKLDWQSGYHIHNFQGMLAEQASLEEKLRESIIKKEFELYYLPKIDARTQKLVGLEALLRWQRPGMELVAPGEFIPAAEDVGLMPVLGELVFNMACMQLQKWDRKGLRGFTLAVNISSMQLRDEELDCKFLKIMTGYGIDPSRIELELTENFVFQERSKTSRIVQSLSEAGIKFAIDDFGMGYSSVSLLKNYPINYLKIDRSIVKNLPDNQESNAILTAIVAMAHSLDIQVVAEGVETLAQFEHIKSSDCDEIQGFFIGNPMTGEDIEELIRSYQ